MAKTAEDIFQEALLLSVEERERLSLLLHNTFSDGCASPEIEPAWMEEIERREKRHAEGKTKSVPAEQVFRELREMLDE